MNGTAEVTIEWEKFGEAFVADLWQFFNSDEYSDVVISTEDGHEIKSHRILLAMCSSYFRELFQRNKAPGLIVCLSNMRSDIVLKIFGLIYGGVIAIGRQDLDAFLKAAKYLKLHGFEEVSLGEDGQDIRRFGNRQRSFSLTIQRMDASEFVRNNAVSANNGMTPGMIPMVSSTHEPSPELTTEPMNPANDKFFPSDDSDESSSDN